MKISTNTVNILKNFAKINPSIFIQEGNTLKTMSPSKTIMAKATVDTEFPKRFAIYNLDRFISTTSLFNDPNFDFGENGVTIKENDKKTDYMYAHENTITKTPDREINLPSVDVSITLINEHLQEVAKAGGVLGLPEILIVGDGSNIFLQAADSKTNGDVYSIKIGETNKTFKVVFKTENIKIIPGNYDITVSAKGISNFKGKEVEYWIAIEGNSNF